MPVNFLKKNPMAVVLAVGVLAVGVVLLTMIDGGLLRTQVVTDSGELSCSRSGHDLDGVWMEVTECIGEAQLDCAEGAFSVSECRREPDRLNPIGGETVYSFECTYSCGQEREATTTPFQLPPERYDTRVGAIDHDGGLNPFAPSCVVAYKHLRCSTQDVSPPIVSVHQDRCGPLNDVVLIENHVPSVSGDACFEAHMNIDSANDIYDVYELKEEVYDCDVLCEETFGTSGQCAVDAQGCGYDGNVASAGYCACAPPPLASPSPTTTAEMTDEEEPTPSETMGDETTLIDSEEEGDEFAEGEASSEQQCQSDIDCTAGYVCDTETFECVEDSFYAETEPEPSDDTFFDYFL